MKKLNYLFVIVFTIGYIALQGQECVKCDTTSNNSGDFATALGKSTTASGNYSFAGGENSVAEGKRSFAFGNSTSATGINSFAFGSGSTSSGNGSFALGIDANSLSTGSFAIGTRVKANYALSFAIGSGPTEDVLENNQMETLIIGFNSNKPTLFISRSPNTGWPNDKTGRVAIGNMTDPQAKLHIYSDDNEPAILFLQPSNWSTEYNAGIWLGDTSHSISAEVDKGLVFNTGNNFVFNNGFLGIATDEPSALLDVNGLARIRGLSGDGDRVVVADSSGNLKPGFVIEPCTQCENTVNTGMNSNAIGFETVSTGNSSFASGFRSEATANYTTAMGFYSFATYSGAFALGSTVKSTAHDAVIIGSGGPWNENIYLENNIPRSFMVGFSSHYPTLFVGDSPGYYQTGQVVIGNRLALQNGPQAKLHIYSDNNEPATLFLQPSNWSTEYNAEIWLGDTTHGISAEIDEGLVYKTEENHVFKGGNVYIEDIDKGIIMKSPDGRCWLGKLDNNGVLNFTVLLSCPGEPNAIHEYGGSNSRGALKVYPNPANDYLTVEIPNPDHKTLSVILLDERGVELRFSKTTAEKTQLYTGDLKKGIYFVRVNGDGRKLTAKMVK